MYEIAFAVVLVLFLLALCAPRLLRAIGIPATGEANRAGAGAKDFAPSGELGAFVRFGAEQIGHAKDCLEAENALVRQTQRRVDQLTEEQSRLEDRIKTALSNGDPNHTANENALSLAQVRLQLASNQEQLAAHQQNYAKFAKQVKLGQQKVADARQQATNLGVELEESKREAELNQFAQSFDQNGVTGGISEATAKIRDQIDENRAKSRVAADLNAPALNDAAEGDFAQKKQADAILAEFRPKGSA